eukprot:2517641-Pleurochrysis_carterae.AAC.2
MPRCLPQHCSASGCSPVTPPAARRAASLVGRAWRHVRVRTVALCSSTDARVPSPHPICPFFPSAATLQHLYSAGLRCLTRSRRRSGRAICSLYFRFL